MERRHSGSETEIMEEWKDGRMEEWKSGGLEGWKGGRVEGR